MEFGTPCKSRSAAARCRVHARSISRTSSGDWMPNRPTERIMARTEMVDDAPIPSPPQCEQRTVAGTILRRMRNCCTLTATAENQTHHPPTLSTSRRFELSIERRERPLNALNFSRLEIGLAALLAHPSRHRVPTHVVTIAIYAERSVRTFHSAFSTNALHDHFLLLKSADH